MNRPSFLWREVTDSELMAELEALRDGRYPHVQRIGDGAWSSTQPYAGALVIGRFWSIWLQDHTAAPVAIVLQRRHDQTLWRRSDLHDAGHLRGSGP